MGMFTPAQTPEQEEETRQRRALELARATPDQRSFMYGSMAGEGLGRAIGGAAGIDMRSPGVQQREAEAAAKAEIAALNLDPSDVNSFYPAVIRVLGKHGLTEQAAAMAEKFARLRAEVGRLGVQQKETERKSTADSQRHQVAMKRLELDAEKMQRVGPAAMQMIGQIQRLQQQHAGMASDAPGHAEGLAAIENLKRALEVELAKSNFELKDAGDRLVVLDKRTGAVTPGVDKGAKPETEKDVNKREAATAAGLTAYNSLKTKLQQDYDVVAKLYNHPGLDNFVGQYKGALAQTPPEQRGIGGNIMAGVVLSPAGQEAYALYQQVQGGVFIQALNSLKEAGRNGATGLGALTEVEGSKIQAAKAALNPQQTPEAFRRQLKQYADNLEEGGRDSDAAATRSQISPLRPLNPATFAAPTRGRAMPKQENKPAVAPAAGGEKMRVRRKSDNQTGSLLRRDFNPEKYEEIK